MKKVLIFAIALAVPSFALADKLDHTGLGNATAIHVGKTGEL